MTVDHIIIHTEQMKSAVLRALTSKSVKHLIKKYHNSQNMSQNYSDIIYKSLDSVLEHLKKPQFQRLNAISKLLDIYEQVSNDSASIQGKKYPLIVLEGLDGCGKSTATKRLSSTLDAVLYCTPPPSLKQLRDYFDSPEYSEVRTAFYALGNYIAAMEMSVMLQTKPIVLDRFWHSTAAYALAQAVADNPETVALPPENDSIYDWPKDLLQPDLVAYLCVNEVARLQRLKNRPELTGQENMLKDQAKFRSDVVTVYNRINPKMKYINAMLSKKKTEDQILVHVNPLLP